LIFKRVFLSCFDKDCHSAGGGKIVLVTMILIQSFCGVADKLIVAFTVAVTKKGLNQFG
jgi:hypothetical protein